MTTSIGIAKATGSDSDTSRDWAGRAPASARQDAAVAEVVKLAEVPFPPRRDPAGLVEAGLLKGGDASKRKALLRTALLRWHPDKWAAFTSKIRADEHAELARRLSTITQALVEQKDVV